VVACTQPGDYQVVRVADGDTLTVVNGGNAEEMQVRFACVDAPEVAHNQQDRRSRSPIDRNQFEWGDRAKIRVEQLVQDSANRVDLTITDTDQYGRHVAEVRLGNGTFVQEVLTQEGLVVALREYYEDCPSSTQIDNAEATAKQRKAGVWSDRHFKTPSEYRKWKRS
jgi:endonuclease YncB( thermonuclease family)